MAAQQPQGAGVAASFWPATGPYALDNDQAYRRWRLKKLDSVPDCAEALVVDIADLANPTAAEQQAVLDRCRRTNMAIYRAPALAADETATRAALAAFCRTMGLRSFEAHRSAGPDGIVPIEVADMGGRAGFIPYSTRAINWHTDGYYNYHGNGHCIRAMILHCVRNAAEGGENALLDHDIAYIRLRDENPAFIAALMHPEAMTIPAHDDEAGPGHGAVAGPVFFVHPTTGALSMRYTIRKRHVIWRDDPVLEAARARLGEILAGDPAILRVRMAPDMGLLCNNVLHDRTAFENGADAAGRLLYRIRAFERIEGTDSPTPCEG